MKPFRPAHKRIEVSAGESVRILRELQGYSQNELAKLTHIPRATLSAIENDRVRLGVERAKILAGALQCHPAVLVFPGWEVTQETALTRHPTASPPVCASARTERTRLAEAKKS